MYKKIQQISSQQLLCHSVLNKSFLINLNLNCFIFLKILEGSGSFFPPERKISFFFLIYMYDPGHASKGGCEI